MLKSSLAGLVEHPVHVSRHVHLAGVFAGGQPHRFEFGEPFEAVADGAVVGERAAQPALADEGHPAAGRLAFDGFLGLPLGADEQHQAAVAGHLGEVAVGPQQAANGLAQVDDVDEIALAVDVRPHLGVPTAGPMPEMDAGLDQVLHLDNGHALPSWPVAGAKGPG